MKPSPSNFHERLSALSPATLRGMRRGIEKESLRVKPDGALSTAPHPSALGSALKHPHITTDFSEAQLELITAAHAGTEACLEELELIHRFVYRHIGEEVMWCASMPCGLPSESFIPIGRYGNSNVGRAKTVYRIGLAHRYGRRMQAISGVHYNWSLPGSAWPALAGMSDPNQAYFALIRNFRRHAWLLLFLFGASPAVCTSFVQGRAHRLQQLAPGTLYLPHATSLRMGRLGYLSQAQDKLLVSYNSLESYADSLHDALVRPYPPYEEIGIRTGDEYRQLATSLLQIENEFYSTIRPKRRIRTGERQLHALRERGVEYVEVRAMDLDPFSPIGIAPQTCRFLDVFLLHCLLRDSPPDTPQEIRALGENKQRVAERGRDPGLRLDRHGQMVGLGEWAAELLAECEPIAAALDGAHGGAAYHEALSDAVAALKDPASLPSARMLGEMAGRHRNSYTDFVLARSLEHKSALQRVPLPAQEEARLEKLAKESIEKQRETEAADRVPFETYRQRYLSPESLQVQSLSSRAE